MSRFLLYRLQPMNSSKAAATTPATAAMATPTIAPVLDFLVLTGDAAPVIVEIDELVIEDAVTLKVG